MPDTAGLFTAAGVVGLLALLLLAGAFVLGRGSRGLAKPARGLLLAACVCALCAVAVAAVAGTLLAGADLGWF